MATINYKEDLKKFKIPQARMLYIVYFLSKTNEINFPQKLKLKELIIQEDKQFKKIYDIFESSLNIQKFVSDIMSTFFEKTIDVKSLQIITNKEELKKKPIDKLREAQQQNALADLTSPTGEDLLKAKRKNQKKATNNNLQDVQVNIDLCEEGMSPKIVVNKDISKDKKRTFLEHAVKHLDKNLK